MTATAVPETAGQLLPGPSVDQVLRLQAFKDYPMISLLLTTTVAPRMTTKDAIAMRGLAAEALTRIRATEEGPVLGVLESALGRAVDEAIAGPTSAAIAVLVGRQHTELVPLPLGVRDRAVVDTTFATRDLVRSLHRTPRHVVLVFNSGQARLFDGGAGVLKPAPTESFPMFLPPKNGGTGTLSVAFLRRVDTALGVYLRLRPAPLILIGPDKVLTTFKGLSRNTGRLAGTIGGNLAKVPLSELARRLQPVLDLYLHSRQAEALQLLAARDRAGRVVTGVPAAWLAARHERPEMLVVEESLFYPARISDDGDFLEPASDIGSPDVVDDAVDELIELALRRGAWVALTTDGALTGYDRVALTLRPQH
jgi:hypothetical protein